MSTIRFTTSTVEDGNMAFRYGTTEEVTSAREKFFARAGVSELPKVIMDVEHGVNIVDIERDECADGLPVVRRGDALVTRLPGVALLLLTADCLPVAYRDIRSGAIALLHLGWKSVQGGLHGLVCDYLYAQYGTRTKDIEVLFGPGISATSYMFPEVVQTDALWHPHLTCDNEGMVHIDLAGYVASRLVERGVLSEHITQSMVDTGSDVQYFSHYRSKKRGVPEGRMMTVLMRPHF